MSDYLFSSKTAIHGSLSDVLINIYDAEPPEVQEFHGDWGALAITQSHYHGFRPYEDDQHLMVVIGGPVLYFRDNDFLVEEDSSTATKAIYDRWVVEGNIQWDEDLSGPFSILLIDKHSKSVTVVTDLMAFIPVYSCKKGEGVYLGTHVDTVASVAGESENLDKTSIVDFILNNIITYPYTAYSEVKQVCPSAKIQFNLVNFERQVCHYWTPDQDCQYETLDDAAKSLSSIVKEYVHRASSKSSKLGQFISAGEDSRAVTGMLPSEKRRDAFIFLDSMNREGRVAEKIANIYGASFKVGYRSPSHYLDVLADAEKLVGRGFQYTHAHTLKFDKKFDLKSYPAFFGGFLSDGLFKGNQIKKIKGTARFPFLPQISDPTYSPVNYKLERYRYVFKHIDDVLARKARRYDQLKKIKKDGAKEWFHLYPASMDNDMPYFYANRRLVSIYEPFMCSQAVKLSASVPGHWKLNRRLFNKAMRPFFWKSRWVRHGDGHFPYLNWWQNIPVQFFTWFSRRLARRLGISKGNQGPWSNWVDVVQSVAWTDMVSSIKGIDEDEQMDIFQESQSAESLLLANKLSLTARVNLLQVMHSKKRR